MCDKRVADKPQNVMKSEWGGALLIAMLAIVLLTVIGLVLLNVVRNGFINSASAEADIQAEANAQSGLDEALAIIRSKVDLANHTTGTERLKIGQSIAFLQNNEYPRVKPRFTIKTQILHDPTLQGFQPTPDYPYVQEILVESTGETEGIPLKRTVKKKMTVIVSNIHPVFRYPISAESKLTLNGAASIIGDVLVGNYAQTMTADSGLHINNSARYITNGPSWLTQSTTVPSIKGFVHVSGPGTEYYYKNGGAAHRFKREDFVENAPFFVENQPFEDKKLRPSSPIGITEMVTAQVKPSKFVDRLGATPPEPYSQELMDIIELGSGSTGAISSLPSSRSYVSQWLNVKGTLNLTSQFTIKEGLLKTEPNSEITLNGATVPGSLSMVPGSLYVGFPGDNDLMPTPPDSVPVAADLSGKIQGPKGKMIAVSGNTVLRDFTFLGGGTLYVKGNLEIIGDLYFEGSIYVDGNVELKKMTSINQDPTRTLQRQVIIMASKNFQMSDNLKQNAATNKVRAFLYSESGELNMFGVHSNLFIQGGVHGEKVELNAVKGETTLVSGTTDTIQFDVQSLPGLQSRLRIYYDDAIFSNPPEGIPVTPNISVFVKKVTY